ncbi:MAG: hypothetical protein K0Q95_3186 [Bacteroidota bacterium]|jgi:hypothetical protein|nr:hypothetical protein [Bacteroidota bacterium]
METQINNKRSVPVLIMFLILLSVVLYHSTIYLFPSFIHAWTQSDRYAIALQFLENGFDLFHPATYNLQTVDGITRVDFPLNEFIVAILMKITGTTAPVVFRLYTLTISIIGMVFLYLLTKRTTGSEIKSWLLVLFVFLSPVYVYYQAGFIPSIPAISSVFVAYYYFFLYREKHLKNHLYLCVLFFLLAALMRLPFTVFLVAVAIQQLFVSVKRKIFLKKEALMFGLAFLIIIAYYLYNTHLGRLYGNMFLDSFKPAKDLQEFKAIVLEMYDHWSFHYFTIWHYILMFILVLISVLTFYRRRSYIEEDKKYWFQLFIVSCGMIIYFLLMSSQFYAHDYYFLDSFFIPVILLLLCVIKNLPVQTQNQKSAWTAAFGIAVILFFFANKKTQAERYTSGPWDRAEITHRNFIGTEKFLDSVGIDKNAKILVIDAYTTNAPLILMNRKGYTLMGTSRENIRVALQWCKWDYIAIQDVYLVSDVIKNYPLITSMIERVTGNGKVSFYKKSTSSEPKSLKEFLGITKTNTLFTVSATFDSIAKDPHLTNANNLALSKTHRTSFARLDSATEYGANVIVLAGELQNAENVKALVNCSFLSGESMDEVQLVAAVSSNGEQLFYQNFMLREYFKRSSHWQNMQIQFVFPAFRNPRDEIKIYIWNPSREDFYYDDLEVVFYK